MLLLDFDRHEIPDLQVTLYEYITLPLYLWIHESASENGSDACEEVLKIDWRMLYKWWVFYNNALNQQCFGILV